MRPLDVVRKGARFLSSIPVDDNLDNALGPWGSVPGALGNIGSIVNAVNSASQIASNTFNTVSSGLQNQNLEQYLLGIPLGTPWTPEVPPKPGVFLGKLHSVLITRNDAGGVPLTGRWITGLVT